jgi:ADP-ribose pyrophosphatase
MIFVEQYRIPLGVRTIELPAGIVGDDVGFEEEALEEAARRELLEETGYDAGHVDVIAMGASSPGLTDEQIHLVRAADLTKHHDGGGVEGEDITVHEIGLDGVWGWLEAKQREGLVCDVKVFAGVGFALLDAACFPH